MGVAHAGDNLGAVVLNLHASAAAVALLAAPKLVINGVERDRHSGGKSCEGGYQALAMRLPGGFKSQHAPRIFMLTGRVRFAGRRDRPKPVKIVRYRARQAEPPAMWRGFWVAA
jgi:hypothetical protein